MKKILVVLLGLLLVGALFGAQTSATGDIDVNVTILSHYELETSGSFDFVFNPEDISAGQEGVIYSDDANVEVWANDDYTLSPSFTFTFADVDASPYVTFSGLEGVHSAGNAVHTLTMDVDYSLISADLDWWTAEAMGSTTVGYVTVTLSADNPVE